MEKKEEEEKPKTTRRKKKTLNKPRGCTFAKNKEVLKKSTERAHTPEALKKNVETRKKNVLMRNALMESFKDLLLKEDKEGIENYIKFLNAYMKDAIKKPSGKCGIQLASIFVNENTLKDIDEVTLKETTRNMDFIKYKIREGCFKEQREIIDDLSLKVYKNICLMCGRRSGKTEANARIITSVATIPNSPIFYIGLTFESAINQMFDLVVKCANDSGLGIISSSRNDGSIVFENSSEVHFKGNNTLHDQEKLRGYKARLVIVDEAQSQRNLKNLIDDIIEPLLTDFEDSVLLLSGTPPRIPKTYFENVWKSNGYKKYHWDMRNNPFIPNAQDAIKKICEKKGLTEDSPLIQREYLGQLVYDKEAQIFKGYQTFIGTKNENPRIFGLPQDFKADRIYIGNDYGFSDYNGIVGIACNTSLRKGYVFYVDKFNKATVSDIVQSNRDCIEEGTKILMKNPSADLKAIEIYGDTSDNTIMAEMSRNYGLPCHKAFKYDKDLGIEQLAECMRKGEIMIPVDTPLTEECEMTLHPRDDEDNILAGIDDLVYHPDLMMALLYASRRIFFDWGIDISFKDTKIE